MKKLSKVSTGSFELPKNDYIMKSATSNASPVSPPSPTLSTTEPALHGSPEQRLPEAEHMLGGPDEMASEGNDSAETNSLQ